MILTDPTASNAFRAGLASTPPPKRTALGPAAQKPVQKPRAWHDISPLALALLTPLFLLAVFAVALSVGRAYAPPI